MEWLLIPCLKWLKKISLNKMGFMASDLFSILLRLELVWMECITIIYKKKIQENSLAILKRNCWIVVQRTTQLWIWQFSPQKEKRYLQFLCEFLNTRNGILSKSHQWWYKFRNLVDLVMKRTKLNLFEKFVKYLFQRL